MTILIALVVLEVIGWTLVRTHPEIRAMYEGNTLRQKIVGDLALFGLWPLLLLSIIFNTGGAQ